jgi:hypothetical protein
MARGFESKHVESQQADREQSSGATGPETREEADRLARRRTLELTRVRALADLATAKTPQHRAMLEAAVRALDEQLARL